MRSASSYTAVKFALALTLLGGCACAAPTIEKWTFESDGMQEKISLNWNEAGSYEVSSFPGANEFVVVLHEASLAERLDSRLDTSPSSLLRTARLQEVTLPNGEKGTQLRLL